MGHGAYSHSAHAALLADRATTPLNQIFSQDDCHALMYPKGLTVRESRDSADHPNSLAVTFALDVTGSMGDIPRTLATEDLPKFMKLLTDCRVDDPQLMFMAVGDATCDRAPLQIGQFESTAELMDQWLTWSWLEGGGGGQYTESYELAFYTMAQHTDIDCFNKRGKKGYFFMTGDELPYPAVSRYQIEALIGDKLDEDIPIEEVIAAAAETWHLFFLIPDLDRRRRCEGRWRELLGDHVICMESPDDTCHVAAGIVALGEGRLADIGELAGILKADGVDADRRGAVVRAIEPWLRLHKAGTVFRPPVPTGGSTAGTAGIAGIAGKAANGGWFKRLFGIA